MTRSGAFVEAMAARFHGIATTLEEHKRDNDGEVLPHVVFADVTRYVVAMYIKAAKEEDLASARELREILDYLENSYASSDEALHELIAASFLENLPYPGEEAAEIRSMLGPTLAEQLREME